MTVAFARESRAMPRDRVVYNPPEGIILPKGDQPPHSLDRPSPKSAVLHFILKMDI
jgi:hypothetical protein